jgi:molybdopterin-containing oxidoreductase family membrane subunit
MAILSDVNPFAKSPAGDNMFAQITDNVSRIAEAPRPPRAWYIAFAAALGMLSLFLISVSWVVWNGIGSWGNMMPVAWGFPIVNFVFWIGIGHAGTLISAILFLLRQNWRTAINRFAEAMTIFAVICAGIFPGIHTGRPWVPYYMFPIPNQMEMWPQFRSPLEWDIFAVGTYATVSILFWYMGMIPDFATFRDRTNNTIRRIAYGFLAMGWRGSSRQWHRYERAYLILAALATPLVLSVHSVVSFDFATAQLPGWHTTIFPPYFVAGAIFGGFAMVVTLAVPARQFFGLKRIITIRHLELMNKIMIATGLMVGYAYAMEFFIAWYSGSSYEGFTFINRAFGPYAWAYWTMISCNVLFPQLHWFKAVRTNPWATLIIGMLVNVGMWFERFVIICTSLAHDFLPSSWGYFLPTPFDFMTLAGSFGLFFTLFLLFCRYLPMVAMAEVKAFSPAGHAHGEGAH